jgi:hypothetical protein
MDRNTVLEHLLPLPRYIERESCLSPIFMILSVWQQMNLTHAKSFVSTQIRKAFAAKTFYTSGSKCSRSEAQNLICCQVVAADALVFILLRQVLHIGNAVRAFDRDSL